jgi:aspartyl protease
MLTVPLSLDALLALVRQRLGAPSGKDGEDLVVSGRAEHLGSSGSFTWRFGPDSAFVRRIETATTRTVGADKERVWIKEGGSPVRDLEWGDADQARLISAVLCGNWLSSSSGIAIDLLPDSRLRLALGRQDAVLTLDSETLEPRALEVRSSFADSTTWTFSNFERDRGLAFPRLVEQKLPAGVVNRFEVSSITRQPSDANAFQSHDTTESGRLDRQAPAAVAVERSANGFLLVTPEIDGRVIGSFIFDTGAGRNVITPSAAASLELPAIGASWLGLAAGASSGTVREARSMRLGPLTIDRPAFVEMDLSALSAVTGTEIAGILGYEVLRRAIVEVDVTAPFLAILDPASPPDVGGLWQPIVIYGNHVYVRARFEKHEGWFRLDTGAPQLPIIFNAPAVHELSLLEGRATTRARIGVPGGDMEVAMGQVVGLKLAGHVFDTLPALFPSESTGAFADRETIGNLGQECLRPFRVYFDYRRKRAAFLKRD